MPAMPVPGPASVVQRRLSHQSCSTSSPSGALVVTVLRGSARRGVACAAESVDARQSGKQGRSGWVGTGCSIQRRPQPPQILADSAREAVSLSQGLRGKLGRGVLGQTGYQDVFDSTEFVAETLLPTRTGKYRLRGYRHTVDGGRTCTEPSAIITGRPEGGEGVPVRVHDACFTSEVLGSLKCDCAEQLDLAMDYIQEVGTGIIIYLQQEGRGIGLANKIAAYALQEEGLDTVDANRALGLPDDCREYTSVRNILAELGVKSIFLMTNNPRKIQVLEQLGVAVKGRIPCIVKAQAHSIGYLATKKMRMKHLMDVEQGGDGAALDGSFCYWNHDGEPLQPSATKRMSPAGAQPLIAAPAAPRRAVGAASSALRKVKRPRPAA